MSDFSADGVERCQDILEYRFKNPDLLREALTHASIAPSRQASNERLEFLGDAVLGLIVCQHLFTTYADYLEGELTKIKSAAVSRATCAQVARSLGLPDALCVGKGLDGGVRLPSSVAAAVYESVLGALFLDAGLEVTRAFVLKHLVAHIEDAVESTHQRNYKSQLQQHAQKVLGMTPTYEVLDEKGPDHSKCFEIAVRINGRQFPGAWGRSKKDAEQKAAYSALIDLKVLRDAGDAE